ncbi:MAG: cytidine deaminase [Candidatus Kapabacteria bacterium]|nr:cytidine deaminase [Candidatus Kapabacteria bacterium]
MKFEIDTTLVDAAVNAALLAREHAYAPYSAFRVGAAVVDADGAIHVGCNVENASYGLTNCAERAAVAAATVAGRRDIQFCVVVTDANQPATPCGACRQVLSECAPEMPILCTTPDRKDVWYNLSDLLPTAFGPSSL